MPLNALNSSDATPLNQPLAHQLGRLQNRSRLKERLQPAGRTERKKKSLSAINHALVYCTRLIHFCSRAACELCASLRCVFAHFLAVAKILTVCRYNTSAAGPQAAPWLVSRGSTVNRKARGLACKVLYTTLTAHTAQALHAYCSRMD